MPKPKQSQPRQPNPGAKAKSAKITDEKALYFIGAVLDEVIAEWSDNDNFEELEDLNDFKDQLKEKSKLYVVAEDDDNLSLRQREKGEPATIVEANFIELTNNQWSKVGVNYKIEGTSATASSADIAPVMQKCTDDEYADNQYSMGKLCAAFNFDKNEEEEKILTQLHKMESKNPTAPAKGKTKEKKLDKDNNGLNDLDDLNEVISPEQEKPSSPSKTTIAERIEAARASQPTTGTGIEDDEDEDFNEPSTPSKTTIAERIKAARASQPTTGIEDDEDEALDEPSTSSRPTIEEQIKAARTSKTTTSIEIDENEDFNEPSTPSSKVETSRTRQPTTTGIEIDEDDTDFETLDDFDFDSNFSNIIEDIDDVEVHVSEKQQPESTLPSVDSNLDRDTEKKYEGANPARPKSPDKNTLSEIGGNREIQSMSQGLTSAGPGLNGFNEIGLASQAALLTIAVAGKAVDCIAYLKEKLAEHNQNKQLKEIIKLAETTQARIEKTSERISTVQEVEASSPTAQTPPAPVEAPSTAAEPPSERSQASSPAQTASAPVEAPSTAAEPPSERSQSSSPVEATSERSQGQAQAPEQPHTKPIQKPNPTTEVETAGDALAENLGLTASAKLEIDEKASIDEQLKQIKQYLTGLNQKLDKLEERLDIIEEKLGISKVEKKGVSAPATNENNELNGKLINYAKAAKECAEGAGQKPGNLICLPVGDNKLTVDFQAAQTSTRLTSKDNKDLFAASASEGKNPNIAMSNLTEQEKNMIVKLPQDKDEFKQLISAQAMAKTVVECSSATGKNPF